MRYVIVHDRVDADAVISAFIYSRIHSIPEDNVLTLSNLKELRNCEIAVLDIPDDKIDVEMLKENNVKLIEYHDHHKTEKYKSTAEVLKSRYGKTKYWKKLYDHLVEYANICDTGEIHTYPKSIKMFSVGGYITALKKMGLDDKTIIKDVFMLLDSYKYTEEENHNVDFSYEIINVCGYDVAVIINASTYANAKMFDMGIRMVIFLDGYNMGIIRNARCSEPNLRGIKKVIGELLERKGRKDEIKEWFEHPLGFMVCRGTGKYPAKTPSALTVWDLVECLRRHLIENKG